MLLDSRDDQGHGGAVWRAATHPEHGVAGGEPQEVSLEVLEGGEVVSLVAQFSLPELSPALNLHS